MLWTSPIDNKVLVRVDRRADGAVVEELVDNVGGVEAAVGRLVGQVPASLQRLNGTSPVVVAEAVTPAAPPATLPSPSLTKASP